MANPQMILIASNTVGAGGVSSVTFSSIPQTYTDLIVKWSARDSTAAVIGQATVTFNGTTSGYSEKRLQGDGTTAGSGSSSGSYLQYFYADGNSATANTFGNGEVYIPNYTSSNNKSVSVDSVLENNATAAYDALAAGLWSNTAAITSITFTAATSPWQQYSSFYLYGITRQ